MTFSLNEVETTAKKAARGAGHSWGMAEEAGWATRWLCAHGFDGCGTLAALLLKEDGAVLGDMAPIALSDEWSAASGTLSALMAGAALSDSAFILAQGEIRIRSVALPMLLIPFAATAARQLKASVTLEWTGASITTNGTDVNVAVKTHALIAQSVDLVRIYQEGSLLRPISKQTRVLPHASDWDTLNILASRTYAPATEESRLLGAGADFSDNN